MKPKPKGILMNLIAWLKYQYTCLQVKKNYNRIFN